MQYVRASLHQPHVDGGRVAVLTVRDRVDEAVLELTQCAEQVRLDEVHHTVVCEFIETATDIYISILYNDN